MARFDYFVVFAEMRTGSNFLEANINAFADLSCHGEAFNPHFVGYPDKDDVLGVTQAQREADPQSLIDAVKAAPGLAGFRFFNDHDPRVLDGCLTDPRCAKIILTRNPVDSFVSWKIASATGQWKLTNATHAKTQAVTFDGDEFEAHMADLQAFQVKLLNTLQRTGQTAFYVAYEDLQDVDVMNGLAMFLGAEGRIANLDRKLKKQNPAPMSSKVANFEQMEQTLARMDRFNLNRTPNFEPRRGPLVPTYVAAANSPLLFLPLKSGPVRVIESWMAALDGVTPDDLQRNFGQKTLRDWMNDRPGHRSFTVLRHPVAWAHTAFCDKILATGPGSFAEIRGTLRKVHKLEIPDHMPDPATDPEYDMDAHRRAFLTFLKFLRSNLSAQTATRVDPSWSTQLSVLQSMVEFGPPDMILREDRLRSDLAGLAGQLGRAKMPVVPDVTDPLADRLAAIYDAEVEAATRQAFARDYQMFGFDDYAA